MRSNVAYFALLGAVFVAHCLITEIEGAERSEKISPSQDLVTHRGEFDVQIGAQNLTLKFELFGSVVPKTVKNFAGICSGDNTARLSYDGTPFHRIIPNFMIQGGDITMHNGTGGQSIYGAKFEDENFNIKHDRYVLSMANAGPNTNSSQFFITTVVTSWLDDKHVVFGRMDGDKENVKAVAAIESYGSNSGRPSTKIVLKKCRITDASAA